jgi:hypothetical protein
VINAFKLEGGGEVIFVVQLAINMFLFISLCDLSGSHGGEYEYGSLLGYSTL